MPERVRDINLLPTYERQSASPFYIFIAIIIITFTAYAFIGYTYFTTKSKLNTAEERYAELNDTFDYLQAEVAVFETGDTGLEQAVTFAENRDLPTSIFIDELNELLLDESYLTTYEYSSQIANITTHSETLEDVAKYTTKLVTSDYINDTKVDNITTFTLKDEAEEIDDLTTIPRYEATYTLQLDRQKLKGVGEDE